MAKYTGIFYIKDGQPVDPNGNPVEVEVQREEPNTDTEDNRRTERRPRASAE